MLTRKPQKINTKIEKVFTIFETNQMWELANEMEILAESIKMDLETMQEEKTPDQFGTTVEFLIQFARKWGDQISSIQKIKDGL